MAAFDHRASLFCLAAVAHLVRCSDEAGLLDEAARLSIRGHFRELAASAEDDATLHFLDQLVAVLPGWVGE